MHRLGWGSCHQAAPVLMPTSCHSGRGGDWPSAADSDTCRRRGDDARASRAVGFAAEGLGEAFPRADAGAGRCGGVAPASRAALPTAAGDGIAELTAGPAESACAVRLVGEAMAAESWPFAAPLLAGPAC